MAQITMPSFLVLRASSVCSGNGVFVAPRCRLTRGMKLGRYEGLRMSRAEFEARGTEGYDVLYVRESDSFIDGSVGGSWTRFVNSPHGTDKSANVAFDADELVVGTLAIDEGMELLVDYGECFPWD